jgi:hypothetical protein
MTTPRKEAQDPATAHERLHELIHLDGNRGNGDKDAGWYREHVAANPIAAPGTLRASLPPTRMTSRPASTPVKNPALDARNAARLMILNSRPWMS